MKNIVIIVFSLLLSSLASCNGSSSSSDFDGDTLKLEHSQNLTLIESADEYKAVIANPWDSTSALGTYQWRKDTPYKRVLVGTSVHCALLKELGAEECIVGVFDKQWIKCLTHEVTDCGNGMEPNVEAVIQLNPDIIFISSFENNAAFDKLSKLGIPIVQCSDYMEPTALGRAEWVRFFGRLVGKGDKADSLYHSVVSHYTELKEYVDRHITSRVKIVNETCYGDVWYQSGKNSTIGQVFADAGADNPFADDIKQSGIVPLSAEQVYLKAHDAQVWLLKYSGDVPKTLTSLGAEQDVYKQFDAYKSGNVWGCNTTTSRYYEEVPFHPDYLLEDFITILHSKDAANENTHYYTRLSR